MKLEPQHFITHACEQVLRFTSINDWDDLTEKVKVQLAFNMGVVALGLDLSKEDGYMMLASTCQQEMSSQELHQHMRSLVEKYQILISEENVTKPF